MLLPDSLSVEMSWLHFEIDLTFYPIPFQMEGIEVKFSDDAEEKVQQECCPGKPFITFRTEVGLC